MAKEYRIICSDNAFESSDADTKFIAPVPLDGETEATLTEAEKLDRYDDLAFLKIDAEAYAQKPYSGVKYGIEYDDKIHVEGSVIRHHQLTAAARFLRELRGFGLLADTVGSGKTFETGVILSELALRGRMKSLLFVVPAHLKADWIQTMENQFGMGVGSIRVIRSFSDIRPGDFAKSELPCVFRPIGPIMISTEDFCDYGSNHEAEIRFLFDVIVVDEAHALCRDEQVRFDKNDERAHYDDVKYSDGMRLLSRFVELKKSARSTYCILLSATPHSGNLDAMFPLWYFIRRNGGVPEDFDLSRDCSHTDSYKKEQDYYLRNVCLGAHTVSEYIARSRQMQIMEKMPEYKQRFLAYIKANNGLTEEQFKSKSLSECTDLLVLYLDFEYENGHEEIKNNVLMEIAKSYHNSVLRSIMIRQARPVTAEKKNIFNVYIMPMENALKNHCVEGIKRGAYVEINGERLLVDLNELRGTTLVRTAAGQVQTVTEYCEATGTSMRDFYILCLAQWSLGGVGEGFGSLFKKANSRKYYTIQFGTDDFETQRNRNIFLISEPCMGGTNVFMTKVNFVKKLIREKNERIVIFFDYDLPKNSPEASQWDALYNELIKEADIVDRIMYVSESNAEEMRRLYERKDNAVMIYTSKSFTEGANLQQGRILINFQVTPDPLAMDQSIGRLFRIGQQSNIDVFSLADMTKLEGYSLAYYNKIGLLSSNSGDATILAGSNSERMVVVRCPKCKSPYLCTKEEYLKRTPESEMFKCRATDACRHGVNGENFTRREEINVVELRCDSCNKMLRRSQQEGEYMCFSSSESDKGRITLLSDSGKKIYGCSTLCKLLHCSRYTSDECGLKKEGLKNITQPDLSKLMLICAQCEKRKKGICTCNLTTGTREINYERKTGCAFCDYANCDPKPYELTFNDDWVGKCRVCGKGHFRPVAQNTFAAYMKTAFSAAGSDQSFCELLLKEASKVADIMKILKNDKEVKRDDNDDIR